MSDRGADGRLPDSIDQRLDICTDHLYGGLIGLVMGFIGAVASVWFVSVALISRSQPVAFLDRAGEAANGALASLLGPGLAGRIDLVPGDLRHGAPRRRPRRALRADRHALRLARRPRRAAAAPSSGRRATAPGAASSPRC